MSSWLPCNQKMNFILTEQQNGVCKITLNRPDKFNSFCREMAFEFQQALDDAATNEEVRCVLIIGNGKAFCAGQDLAEAMDDNGIEIQQIVHEHYNPIIERIRKIEKPVVCAVNGVAAGAGANIALCCDITVATESASFIQAFSKIGLIPDSGGTYFLPRLIGFQKASAFMMLGDKISANEAERCGMIYKYFADDVFSEESLKLAQTLASMPTKGLALTKQLLNETYQHSLGEQLQREEEIQVQAASTYDYKEGVNAFLEKRKPSFMGK